jgi:Right handed beta helix region/Carboxypeptidase regulatory-like domain
MSWNQMAIALPNPTTPNPLIPARIIANPGFEQPAQASNGAGFSVLEGYGTTPPTVWQTTEDTAPYVNSLEYWRGVNTGNGGQASGPHSGNQHIELNASTNAAVYQDICVLQNETINWSLWHAARLGSESDDTNIMRVTVSNPSDWTGKTPPTTPLYSSPDLSTQFSQGWSAKNGSYTHSQSSGKFRFAFHSIQGSIVATTRSLSYGNFLDDVLLSMSPVIDFLPTDLANGVNIPTTIEGNIGSPYYLSLRVNGRLQSAATVTIAVNGLTAPRSFTVGTPLQGSAAVTGLVASKSGSNITLTLPAGDYDPNNTAQYVHIPIDFGDLIYQANDNVTFGLSSATGGGSGTISVGSSACETARTSVPSVVQEDDIRQIQGKVFEDVNYSGGAGRNFSTSGNPRPNVRVELYNSSGSFVTSTNTDSNGSYQFINLPTSVTYYVRVVNSTVTSARPLTLATITGLKPVQTFRRNAPSGAAIDVTNKVGGENPTVEDAGNGSAGTIMSPAGILSGNLTGQAQSIATVAPASANITDLDFGFNFDTIVNTNNAGQGSLRQFIVNSNALGNSTLNQVTKTAGVETSIFMIPVAALSSNVARIAVAASDPLPAITDPFTHLDGGTQTANIGNTNNVLLGTGGTVGTDNRPLSQLNGPEVEIYDVTGGAGATVNQIGLNLQASDTRISKIAIWGFGGDTSASTTGSKGNIVIDTSGRTNINISENVIGTRANSFSDPGANRSGGYGISSQSTAATVQNFTKNLIGYNGWGGLEIGFASAGINISGNEIRGNAINALRADGTAISAGGGLKVEENLFSGNYGPGVDTPGSTGSNLYRNNTIEGNGIGGPTGQNSGMRLQGTNNIIEKNVIRNNSGAGILVRNTAAFNLITQNSIFNNGTGTNGTGQIGIDLVSSSTSDSGDTGATPFVSSNLATVTGTNANDLIRFPVLTETTIGSGNLIVKGFAPAGARIELFIADGGTNPNPRPTAYSLNFGEGKTYLTTVTEGSASDTDSTTGNYANDGTLNAAGTTAVTANRFTFSIPIGSTNILNGQPLSVGTQITATASLLNGTATVGGSSLTVGKTSEFSGVVNVVAATTTPGLQFIKRITGVGKGTAFSQTANPNDGTVLNTITNDLNWPASYLVGATNGGKVLSQDEVEYTIYFANVSSLSLNRARLCDLLKPNQTYIPGSMKIAIGNGAPVALTDGSDSSDRAQFRLADTPTAATDPVFAGCNLPASNTNGVVMIDLVGTTGIPNLPSIPGFNGVGTANSYGFLRFRVKVN